MNGARTTFLRRGYVLTALAAAVLLAASPGTALAQTPSVDFETHSGTVGEGATATSTTNPALKVKVRVSGLPSGPMGNDAMGQPNPRQAAVDKLGTFTYRAGGDGASLVTVSPATQDNDALDSALTYKDTIELTIVVSEDDANWKDDSFTLKVVSTENIVTGGTFNGTIKDNEFVPVAEFSRTSIKITENSKTDLSVKVKNSSGQPGATATTVPDEADDAVVLMVSPADAIFIANPSATPAITGCPTDSSDPPGAVFLSSAGTATYDSAKGELTINGRNDLVTAQVLTLEACADKSGYQDAMITLSFKKDSLKTSAAGTIQAGPDAVVLVESDEETPVVGIVPGNLSIDEGSSDTFVVFADGKLGTEVMSAMLSMSGDAMVSLSQDGKMIEAGDDGMYTVNLGSSASTRVMVTAEADRYLEDGATKMATFTLESADGADIGSDDSVTVTVTGVPSVPALPLVGQLLLALFLMAGGSRLYRRRG